MGELIKYTFRFGICLVLCLPFILSAGEQALRIAFYKLSMVTLGVFLSELFWAAFFKPYFGSTEEFVNADRLKAVLIFRGMLYGAVILGLTLGL